MICWTQACLSPLQPVQRSLALPQVGQQASGRDRQLVVGTQFESCFQQLQGSIDLAFCLQQPGELQARARHPRIAFQRLAILAYGRILFSGAAQRLGVVVVLLRLGFGR